MPSTATDRLDGLTTSVAVKPPCKAVSTSALTLSGEQTIGGVSCVTGDRVLYALAGGSVSNGVWVVSTGAWSRAKDFDGNRDVVQGTMVGVIGASSMTIYRVETANPIVIGTTAIQFGLAGMNDLANAVYSGSENYASGTVGRAIQEMLGTKSTTLYVATTGSDSNDGSSGAPFATLQKAFDTLMALGIAGGTRIISVAAGTYSSASARVARIGPANESETTDPDTDPYQTNGVASVNYIIVKGADVGYDPDVTSRPTPTTIFDGGGAAAVGIQIEGPIKVLIKDIKFQNYDGSSSSGGIIGDGALIRCENVHGDGNYYDISNSRGRLEVKGGLLNGAQGAAIRSIFNNKHEIGNQQAGATGQGPRITNAQIGVYAQEGATGHADYVEFDTCVDGIFATVNSRVNYTGSTFTSCTRGVRALQAYCFATAGSVTFTSCTENKVIQMFGVDAPRMNYGNAGLAAVYLGASALTHTGSTASTEVIALDLEQGDFCPNVTSIRKPQHVRFEAYGTMSGTADTKQFKLRLGATLLATITNASTDTGSWHCRGLVVFHDSNVQSAVMHYGCHLVSNERINVDTGTEDLAAADAELAFEIQLSNSADTIVVNHAHFEVWG